MGKTVTPEQAEEFKRLYAEYERAAVRAGAALQIYGVDSKQFANADRKTVTLWRRLRDIQEKI